MIFYRRRFHSNDQHCTFLKIHNYRFNFWFYRSILCIKILFYLTGCNKLFTKVVFDDLSTHGDIPHIPYQWFILRFAELTLVCGQSLLNWVIKYLNIYSGVWGNYVQTKQASSSACECDKSVKRD